MDRRRAGGCGFTSRLLCHSGSRRIVCASGKGAVLTPIFEEVALTGSTNADLLERAAQGATEGLWLRAPLFRMADVDDWAGLGKARPAICSPAPSCAFSANDPSASTLAFVAALAAHDAVQQIAPEVTVQIKWPNDLLADGAKLCGMLLERAGDAVVVGIGLNLVSHPQGLERPVTDLVALGARPPHPQAVVEILANAFAIWLDRWRMGGIRGVAQSWLRRLRIPIGTALTANLPDGSVQEGLYAGLSDDGALQLRLADGSIRAIHAGDVFLI